MIYIFKLKESLLDLDLIIAFAAHGRTEASSGVAALHAPLTAVDRSRHLPPLAIDRTGCRTAPAADVSRYAAARP